MDFVVVGLGLGAIGILLGLLLRDAPGWRAALAPGPAADGAPPVADTFARGLGTFLLVCGAALTVLTFLGLGTGLSDDRGTLLVAGTVTIALLGLVAWLVQQLRHRPSGRPAAVADVAASDATAPPSDSPPLGSAAVLGAALAAGATELTGEAEGFGLNVESTVVSQEASEFSPEFPEADEPPAGAGLRAAHATEDRAGPAAKPTA